jgi:hypothetical protein
MPESYAQLQADGPGRKVHTRQRTVGGNAVEEQIIIPLDSDRVLAARFYGDGGLMTVQASADASKAGRWFLFNPVASSILIALRRVEFASQHSSVLATPTTPRIALRTFTATGTFSGTSITPAPHDTTDAAQVAVFGSNTTGLTLTDGAIVRCFFPTVALTAVGIAGPSEDDWIPDPAYPLILRPGQGVYLTQLDNGTASDTRKYLTGIVWDEFTQP